MVRQTRFSSPLYRNLLLGCGMLLIAVLLVSTAIFPSVTDAAGHTVALPAHALSSDTTTGNVGIQTLRTVCADTLPIYGARGVVGILYRGDYFDTNGGRDGAWVSGTGYRQSGASVGSGWVLEQYLC